MAQRASAQTIQALRDVLARWPKDPLRPACQLGDALTRHLDDRIAGRLGGPITETEARTQAGMLDLLSRNQIQAKYPTPIKVLVPQSRPDYFPNLERELDTAPTRSWLATVWEKMKSKVRVS